MRRYALRFLLGAWWASKLSGGQASSKPRLNPWWGNKSNEARKGCYMAGINEKSVGVKWWETYHGLRTSEMEILIPKCERPRKTSTDRENCFTEPRLSLRSPWSGFQSTIVSFHIDAIHHRSPRRPPHPTTWPQLKTSLTSISRLDPLPSAPFGKEQPTAVKEVRTIQYFNINRHSAGLVTAARRSQFLSLAQHGALVGWEEPQLHSHCII